MVKEKVKNDQKKGESQEMVERYYKKIMRILEYYVLICFILITFVPLLDFNWVPGFIKFVYLTGFPLLIIIFIISLLKDPIQILLLKVIEK